MSFQTVLIIISAITLYFSVVWISFYIIKEKDKKYKLPDTLPFVSIGVPAWNEGHHVIKTLHSLKKLNYPKDKFEIIIVNDGSTDDTKEIIDQFVKENKQLNLNPIHKKINKGKAAALNSAIKHAKGEYFSCLDADTEVDRNSLKLLLANFDEDTGAVVSSITVKNKKGFFVSMQKLEYIFANFYRALMMSINTLCLIHGGLSTYKTDVLKKVGGFHEAGMTEDLEMGLRLNSKGYKVKIEKKAKTFTTVPSKFKDLWKQRIRWYRGFIVNHYEYRNMFFKKKHGLLGSFQMPINVLGIPLLAGAISIIVINLSKVIYEFVSRSLLIEGYFFNSFSDWPSIKELILVQDLKVLIPFWTILTLWGFTLYVSHKQTDQSLKPSGSILSYLFIYPFLTAFQWVAALFKEITKSGKKWK